MSDVIMEKQLKRKRDFYHRNRERLLVDKKEYHNKNKDTINKKKKIYRDANRKIINNNQKEWKVKNKNRDVWHRAKYRAKEKGLEFDITIDDIIIPEVCPVLGIPIIINSGKPTDNSPSLDRIDSTKGYIKGNVRVISFRANTIKSNGSYEEHLLISKYIKENTQVISCDYSI